MLIWKARNDLAYDNVINPEMSAVEGASNLEIYIFVYIFTNIVKIFCDVYYSILLIFLCVILALFTCPKVKKW